MHYRFLLTLIFRLEDALATLWLFPEAPLFIKARTFGVRLFRMYDSAFVEKSRAHLHCGDQVAYP